MLNTQTKSQWVLLGVFFIVLGGVFLLSPKNSEPSSTLLDGFSVSTIIQGILCIWIGIKNYRNSVLRFSFGFSLVAILLSLIGPYVLATLLQETGAELGIYVYAAIPLALLFTIVGVFSKQNQL